jgi:hypothetical protein
VRLRLLAMRQARRGHQAELSACADGDGLMPWSARFDEPELYDSHARRYYDGSISQIVRFCKDDQPSVEAHA